MTIKIKEGHSEHSEKNTVSTVGLATFYCVGKCHTYVLVDSGWNNCSRIKKDS